MLLEPIPKGSPFWRLNATKIDSHYVNTLTHALVPLARLDPLSILDRWEGVKDTVHSISSYRRPHWRDKKEFPGDHSSLSPQQSDPLKAQYEKRLLLGRISADRARELPSPLISHMIDHNINENHIPGIRTPDGSVSTRQEDIHNSFHSFYSDLYSPKPTSTTHINKHIPRLPTELIASLSNPFTIADVLCVTKKAKKNSAPGPDGIPYSLYERVPILQVLLIKVIQASIQTGRCPPSWGLSYIRPILKPEKDPLLASSYRPIALLCTDYKIFSSVIAGRFKPYLSSIFPDHQSGYINGRSTHHGALRFSHLIKNTLESFPLLVDSEKAYDRVSHEWLSSCLTISEFPTALVTLLLAIHQGGTGKVIINNRLSRTFRTHSGVRQGDPLAPILFILSIEPLLRLLEENNVNSQSHCDDLAIVATSNNLQTIHEALTTYEISSGARLNAEKSFIITRCPISNSPFPSCRSPRRYLGFHISASGALLMPPAIVDECIEALQRIKRLPLSLAGRMSILSGYIRPKLFYRLAVTPFGNTSDYLLVERWFLSSSTEYDPARSARAPFSDTKLSHPAFHFRLQPFHLALHLRRLSIHIRTSILRLTLTNHSHWLPNSIRTNNPTRIRHLQPPWKIPASAIPALIHLLPYQTTRTNKAGILNSTGRYLSIVSVSSTPPSPHAIKERITSKLRLQHLPLSPSQARTFQAYNTDVIALFNTIHRLHLRPAILSFIWRLLHKTLHLHLHNHCPFCRQAPLNTLHLFSTCPTLSTIVLPPSPLSHLLSPPHDKTKTLNTTIMLWAIWKLFNKETHEGPLPNDARSKVLLLTTSDELSRVKLAHSH